MVEHEWAHASGLPGRGVIVTGAASGIGRVAALSAGRAGMNVVMVDRDRTRLMEAQVEVEESTGASVRAIGVDLSDLSQHRDIISVAKELPGTMHLFHAAGVIVRRETISEVTEADWDFQVDVNQKASWFLTRAFCESLIETRKQGSVVLVASISANLGLIAGSWVYAATKGGMLSMVRGFAKTYAADGIRVNALSPGIVETPLVNQGVQSEAISQLVDRNIPIGRTGRADEVAAAGLFLLSDYASYVTGTNLDVDGGWLRR